MIKRLTRRMRKKKYTAPPREITSNPSPKPEELHSWIEKKAYELFETRSSTHGNDWDDWFEAEKLVNAEISQR